MRTALNGDLESMLENAKIVGENGCVFARTESTDAKSATGARKMENILTHNVKLTGAGGIIACVRVERRVRGQKSAVANAKVIRG